MKKRHVGVRMFVVLLAGLIAFPASLIGASSPPAATTEVEHEVPGKEYIPGFRINLEAEITDDAGLLATRCYFKTKNDENFAFIDMFDKGGDLYQATLPAPFVNSEAVEYLFVVVNSNKQVTRTDIFMLEEGETEEATAWKDINEVREIRLDKVQDIAEKYVALYNSAKSGYIKNLPDYQRAVSDTVLSVKTELASEQVPVRGFSDVATVAEVPATAKFGFLAKNLYTADAIAASGGVAAAGTTAGTVAVAGGGMSALGIGAIVVGSVAVVGAGGLAVAEALDESEETGDVDISSRNVSICIIDFNSIQDEYFDLYVNGSYIGEVNNPPGGTTCHNVTLRGGTNSVELRITNSSISDTKLTISINNGEWERDFEGDDESYSWNITA